MRIVRAILFYGLAGVLSFLVYRESGFWTALTAMVLFGLVRH